jgi:hypothetical protein
MENPMKLASLIAVAGIAAAASAQNTITYSWSVSDTGNADGVIEPGEAALLTLSATMAPTPPVGFAGSIYDIIGGANWTTGTLSNLLNKVDTLATGPGTLNGNDIMGIEAFQLPPFFNPNFNAANPIAIYSLTWTPADYTARVVGVTDANHLNNDVYVDTFGGSASYTGIAGAGSFNVVPAPASLALLGLGGLVARRRR